MANGNLNTTVTVAAFNTAAKLVKKSHDILVAGSTLLRCETHIDATIADTLIAAIVADGLTIANPKADGQTYTGTFVRSDVYMEEPSDQETGPREVTVYELLTKVNPSTALPTPIQMAETEILDAFSLEEGTRYMVGYKYVNLNPTERALCMVKTITAPTVSVLYVEKDRKFDVAEKGDRTATLTVLFYRMVWNAFAVGSPDHTALQNEGTEHEQKVEEWYNVEKDDALSGLYTPTAVYNVMRTNIRDNKNGSMDITRTQWHEAYGASGSELEADRIKLMNPHALQYGTLNRLTVINENMLAASTAHAVPAGGVGSWILVDTYEEFTQSGLWNKYYVYETVTWNAWDHDSGAEDKIEYDNADTDADGTGSLRERITKTWFGITNSYLAAATTALRTGSTNFVAEAGYVITNVGVRDNQDGSITLVQVQKMQIDDKDAGTTGAPIIDKINPHGWNGGTINAIHIHYEHFKQDALASAISDISVPGGTYVLVQARENIEGDGLYSRVYRYESPSWTNTDGEANATLTAGLRVFGYHNYNPVTSAEGLDVKRVDGGDGIPIADLADILAYQPLIASHVLDSVDIRDNGNGSGSYRRTQTLQRGTGDQFYRHWVAANGRQEEEETLGWKNLTYINAVSIQTNAHDNSTAMGSATPAAHSASHKLRSVTLIPHDNGLFDVVRVTFIPRYTGGGRIDGADDTQAPWKLFVKNYANSDGFGAVVKYVRIDRLITNSSSAAAAFADSSSPHPVVGGTLGSMDPGNNNEWIGYKVRTKSSTTLAIIEPTAYSTFDE